MDAAFFIFSTLIRPTSADFGILPGTKLYTQ